MKTGSSSSVIKSFVGIVSGTIAEPQQVKKAQSIYKFLVFRRTTNTKDIINARDEKHGFNDECS
jgi:hypothetical protein